MTTKIEKFEKFKKFKTSKIQCVGPEMLNSGSFADYSTWLHCTLNM